MDLPHSELVWTYVVVAAFCFAVILTALQHYWVTPVKRLEKLLAALANERVPRSFSVPGAAAFERIGAHIEKIAARQTRLQEQMAQEEFSLQAILSSMVEGVVVVDTRHVVQEVNDAFLRQFSLTESPLHRPLQEAIDASDIALMIDETFRSGEPQSYEVSLASHEGDKSDVPARHFDVNAIPIRQRGLSQSQPVHEVVAVFHDISRLKQLEDVRREFVANVSHELRTPLSIFRGYVETLIDQPNVPPTELRRILETMRKHSIRLNALVDDLLTLARLESRRLTLERVSVRLQPFLQQILADFGSKLEEKQIAAVLEVPPDLPPLEADPFRLEQVFYNLLDNSIKYSNPHSVITLTVEKTADRIHIRVRDQGLGIPADDVGRIFERFYRVDKARSRGLGGTGLGLSIVKHIVQLHGGEVNAESELGAGTTITVSLPLGAREEDRPLHYSGEDL